MQTPGQSDASGANQHSGVDVSERNDSAQVDSTGYSDISDHIGDRPAEDEKRNTIGAPGPGSSTSPYAIMITQPDSSTIQVLGKGSRQFPYVETIDGYTLLKNDKGIYEYKSRDGQHSEEVPIANIIDYTKDIITS